MRGRFAAQGLVIVCVLAAAMLCRCATIAQNDSISYKKVKLGDQWANVIKVDLNDPQVKVAVAVARGFPHSTESFSSFLSRVRPAAAINGTYFCLSSLKPVGHLVIEGQQVNEGSVGTALTISSKNNPSFILARHNHRENWEDYQTVVGAGPRLLTEGRITLSPRAEGYRDRHVLGSATRSALGVTANRQLLLVTVRQAVSLRRLAMMMAQLGARDAVNLDGGTSSALYHAGQIITHPGRGLTNCLMVFADQASYQTALGELAPGRLRPIAVASAVAQVSNLRPPPGPLPGPVSITDPAVGAALNGQVKIRVAVSPEREARFVTFLVNDRLVGMTNIYPFECAWSIENLPEGEVTIGARAFDASANLIGGAEIKARITTPAAVAQVSRGGAGL